MALPRLVIFEVYNQKDPEPKWDSVTYCLAGQACRKCCEAKPVTPPDPTHFHFKEFRNDNCAGSHDSSRSDKQVGVPLCTLALREAR
jgi:hypothetical protein